MRERARAPAKVNPILRVHEREPSGYHEIETLFCALELADELTIDVAEGRGVRLDVQGAELGTIEENLAVRAARMFLQLAGAERDLAIRLRKRIPAGGGLGGGSSDAAAVLNVLDRVMPGAVGHLALRRAARDLGSDVPFFLGGRPLAWGAGRGERLREAPVLPSMPVLLVIPHFPVATGQAYAWLDASRGGAVSTRSSEPALADFASWEEVAAAAINDFEPAVFDRHPELREIRDLLAGAGAMLSLLSGSGSTVFGIFADDDRANAAASTLRTRVPDVRLELTRTASR